jgi:hypothetical protein
MAYATPAAYLSPVESTDHQNSTDFPLRFWDVSRCDRSLAAGALRISLALAGGLFGLGPIQLFRDGVGQWGQRVFGKGKD